MNSSSKSLVVDTWSDFACPWCWVAKRRFDKALDAFPYKDLVQVNVRAYRLAPNYFAEPITRTLVKKFGSQAPAKAMMDAVTQHAAAEGLVYNFETMLFGDTMDAHVLVKAVADKELQKRLVEALYEQSISHGKSLFDRSVLASIAEGAGVPADVLERAWSTPEFRQQVQHDERAASAIGSGVPLFVFNNGAHVSGAQPTEKFRNALEGMFYQSKAQDGTRAPQEPGCGLDGCLI